MILSLRLRWLIVPKQEMRSMNRCFLGDTDNTCPIPIFDELDRFEGWGLLSVARQGAGKPAAREGSF